MGYFLEKNDLHDRPHGLTVIEFNCSGLVQNRFQEGNEMSLEALEGRELLSVAPGLASRHAHHVHHVDHVNHMRHLQVAARMATATVVTDKLDYQPGQNALITGSGFARNEQVRLQVLHTDGTPNTAAEHQPWIVRADNSGSFHTSYPVGQDDLNTKLQLTAVGLGSDRTATEDFSDSGPIVRPDHIVIVIDEDRACNAIGDLVNMPFYNELAATGLVYTDSHGVAHPASPNYLALYSGSMQGIADNGNNHTFSAPNLASLFNSTQIAPGQYLSFGGFAESLPHDGDMTTRIAGEPGDPNHQPDLYMRNYNPMAEFTNVGTRGGVALTNAQVNKTFASFPTTAAGYAALPTISFVIPNTLHNTHGSNEQDPYATDPAAYDFLRSNSDAWQRDHLSGYLQWAKDNNSLLIITGSEEETDTHPADTITTIVNGDPDLFVAGTNNNRVNHFNLVRTIEDMYGLTPLGDTGSYARFDTNALGQLSTGAQGTTATTISLTSTTSPSLFGQNVTFTATIGHAGAGTATGTVTFMDGSTVLGTGTVNGSGVASFGTTALPAGMHSITAVYAGDSSFSGSTSSALGYRVNAAATSTAVSSVANPSVFGQSVSISATVSVVAPGAGTAAGTVTFKDGTTVLGTATLNASGVATLNTAAPSVGSHSITATYAGNANTSASTSASLGQVVGQASTTTTVTSSVSPVAVGQAVHFVATVAAITPGAGTRTGSVQFVVDGANFGSPVTVAGGIATSAATSTLAVGTHLVSAVYSGDANFLASTAANFTQTVSVATGSNNNFANRTVLSGTSVTTTGSNSGASKETGEPNHGGNSGGKSVWWTWTAPSSGSVTIDTAGSNFDTLLSVYTGSAVSSLTTVASNDDDWAAGLTTSKVSFNAVAGTTYQIAVDGYGGMAGNIALHVNLATGTPAAPAAPTNVAASDGTFSDKVQVTWTASAGASAYEVWRGTTNSSASATKISAGDVSGATFDDTTAVAGTTYYYFVKAKNAGGTSGFSGSNSGYRAVAVNNNNAFANRIVLIGPSIATTGTNSGASKETGEPNHGGNSGGKSVWWSWTAPASGTVTIDTAGSNFDTLLSVYTGSSVSALTSVASNDDDWAAGLTTSKVSFNVTAGTVYQIAVDGYGGTAGAIALHIQLA
jgi:hypothetical protein